MNSMIHFSHVSMNNVLRLLFQAAFPTTGMMTMPPSSSPTTGVRTALQGLEIPENRVIGNEQAASTSGIKKMLPGIEILENQLIGVEQAASSPTAGMMIGGGHLEKVCFISVGE